MTHAAALQIEAVEPRLLLTVTSTELVSDTLADADLTTMSGMQTSEMVDEYSSDVYNTYAAHTYDGFDNAIDSFTQQANYYSTESDYYATLSTSPVASLTSSYQDELNTADTLAQQAENSVTSGMSDDTSLGGSGTDAYGMSDDTSTSSGDGGDGGSLPNSSTTDSDDGTGSLFDSSTNVADYSSSLVETALGGTSGGGGSSSSSQGTESITKDDVADDPIDPRWAWEAFSIPDDVQFEDVHLPGDAFMDDLFQLQPDGQQSFQSRTEYGGTPVTTDKSNAETGDTGSRTVNTRSTVDVDQNWNSPTDWTITQTLTSEFDTEDDNTASDDTVTGAVRHSVTTLTLIVTPTSWSVSCSMSDSFTLGTSLEWDAYPEDESSSGNTSITPTATTSNTGATVAPGSTGSGSSVRPAWMTDLRTVAEHGISEQAPEPRYLPLIPAEDPDHPIDRGHFNATLTFATSFTVSVGQTRVTLPDGRSGTTFSFGFDTSTSSGIGIDGGNQFLQKSGTLQQFQLAEVESEDSPPEQHGESCSFQRRVPRIIRCRNWC